MKTRVLPRYVLGSRRASRSAAGSASAISGSSRRAFTKGRPVDEARLAVGVRTVLARDAATPVLLKADASVPYGRVVHTMVVLQQAGAARIGFLTDPAAAERDEHR